MEPTFYRHSKKNRSKRSRTHLVSKATVVAATGVELDTSVGMVMVTVTVVVVVVVAVMEGCTWVAQKVVRNLRLWQLKMRLPEADGLDEPVGDTGDKDPVSPVC